MLLNSTPKLDLHGETVLMVGPLVNQFIYDNYLYGNKVVRIIHGKSTNILTKEVHNILRYNSYVESFNLNNWNLGETIVILKENKAWQVTIIYCII